ncbi:hypothetical protein N9B90_00670 [bacterium]|nr:hypothetical protein [bacterium]
MQRSSFLSSLLLTMLAAIPAAGCSIAQPAVPVSSFLAGDYRAVTAFAEQEELDGAVENRALLLNVQGQCELAMGDPAGALKSFQLAARIMGTWATSGSEVTAAIVGSESSKTYKGDSYEKAMNAFYLAYCYLIKGEPDNARAALKQGILADTEVADEKFQADNALLFWMAGRMSNLYGGSGADEYFEEARVANDFAVAHAARGQANNSLLAEPSKGNLVILLPIGLGPEKFADGRQEELARFRPQGHPAASARVLLGEQDLGRPFVLSDVNYQAATLGGLAMEGIRKGKAVFKTSTAIAGEVLVTNGLRKRNRRGNSDSADAQLIAGGALLVVSALTAAAADVRYWPTLPSTVQVLTAEVPPGDHDLTVDFLDGRGSALPRLQHKLRITVPASGEVWLLVASRPAAVPQQ